MNINERLADLSALIKQDASIHTKWRNKAIERLNEAQAYILMGRHTTNMKPPEGLSVQSNSIASKCICPMGVIHKACPVHGAGV